MAVTGAVALARELEDEDYQSYGGILVLVYILMELAKSGLGIPPLELARSHNVPEAESLNHRRRTRDQTHPIAVLQTRDKRPYPALFSSQRQGAGPFLPSVVDPRNRWSTPNHASVPRPRALLQLFICFRSFDPTQRRLATPTPFASSTNAVHTFRRGEWRGSAVGAWDITMEQARQMIATFEPR